MKKLLTILSVSALTAGVVFADETVVAEGMSPEGTRVAVIETPEGALKVQAEIPTGTEEATAEALEGLSDVEKKVNAKKKEACENCAKEGTEAAPAEAELVPVETSEVPAVESPVEEVTA